MGSQSAPHTIQSAQSVSGYRGSSTPVVDPAQPAAQPGSNMMVIHDSNK
jgi:hypothetical protein